jgi:hypothetical protein
MTVGRNDAVHFDDVTVKHATDKAILAVIDGKQEWIPKSQIAADSEVQDDGDEGTLIIPEWLAKDKGLI